MEMGIPEKLCILVTLNTLEYVAGYVGCWMEFHETDVAELEVILCQGDSTSAAGWNRKSNFDEEIQSLQLEIAMALATMFMEHNTGLYSQWFRGDWNDVSDSCSRDHHLSEQELTELLLSTVPNQVLMDFAFVPLPPAELVSKLMTWLLKLPKVKQSPKRPLQSKMATGATTSSTSMTSNSSTTLSSQSSTLKSNNKSLGPSLLHIAMVDSNDKNISAEAAAQQLYLDQSAPPSMHYTYMTFRNNNRCSPCRDIYDPSRLATILQKQIKGYTNRDPSVKPQKALPISVFHEMLKIQSTKADIACGQLSAGALFYAMRSCKYVKVSGLK
jgi:hypothetical protein